MLRRVIAPAAVLALVMGGPANPATAVTADTGAVSGVVRDRANRPAPDTLVRLIPRAGASGQRPPVAPLTSAQTSAGGNLLLKDVPPGRYLLVAGSTRSGVGVDFIAVAPGGRTEVSLQLADPLPPRPPLANPKPALLEPPAADLDAPEPRPRNDRPAARGNGVGGNGGMGVMARMRGPRLLDDDDDDDDGLGDDDDDGPGGGDDDDDDDDVRRDDDDDGGDDDNDRARGSPRSKQQAARPNSGRASTGGTSDTETGPERRKLRPPPTTPLRAGPLNRLPAPRSGTLPKPTGSKQQSPAKSGSSGQK